MNKMSQCRRVMTHLRKAPITPLQAIYWMGITRLGARIFDLRQMGNRIDGRMKTVTNRRGEQCRVMEYTLRKEATGIRMGKQT